jgi:hypothetical protein
MDGTQFDKVSRFFAQRRLSRRQALTQSGAALATAGLAAAGLATAASAQDATPAAEAGAAEPARAPEMLFVQSFQSGSIVPTEGVDGRYTVTLERGLGQTIFFSDRPDRIVGATPTPQFLEVLGFPPDNPPNAALVVENSAGETDFAVIELFNPLYDPTSHTATYEVAVLENWEDSLELGFTAAPADLAAVEPTFGAAHLFIDDACAQFNDENILCRRRIVDSSDDIVVVIPASDFGGWCYSGYAAACLPCEPWHRYLHGDDGAYAYFQGVCNERFPGSDQCDEHCTLLGM